MTSNKNDDEKVQVIPRKKVVRPLAVGMEKRGRVRRIAGFGAFVDIGVGTDGLLHISELDANRRVAQVSEVVSLGDEVTVWIKELDRENNRIGLTMIPPDTFTVGDLEEGMVLTGKVTRLAPYGAFVDLGVGRDGMLHVREMGDGYVRAPGDVVSAGDEIEVRVLAVDKRRNRIDLSLKGLDEVPEALEDLDESADDAPPTVMELAIREAMSDDVEEETPKRKRRSKRRREQQRQLDDIIARTIEGHRQAE